MIDLGTGNNNKINWAIEDKQEVIDIVEVAIFIGRCLARRQQHWLSSLSGAPRDRSAGQGGWASSSGDTHPSRTRA